MRTIHGGFLTFLADITIADRGGHPLGDWTDDARELVVFPQDTYPDYAGPCDYTRTVINPGPSCRSRRSARRRGRSLAAACLAGVLALGVVDVTSAETWRGLTADPYPEPLDSDTFPCPAPLQRVLDGAHQVRSHPLSTQ